MENKNDIIKLQREEQNIVVKVNDEIVVSLNKSNNKVDTKNIFDKLNICQNYTFSLEIGETPKEKELEMLFIYLKKFLEDLQKEVDQIDYSKLEE